MNPFVYESDQWFGDIAVNPYKLKEGDKLYTCGSNWRVVQIIDFNCEECNLRHRAVVVAYRNHQFQTWPVNDSAESKNFWLNVVPVKKRDEYKKRFRRLNDLQLKAYREKKNQK
jgi:hypothetical protein